MPPATLLIALLLLSPLSPAVGRPRVVLGGTSGLPSLADAQATTGFRAAPGTGFYLHFSATDPLFRPTLRTVAKIFAGKPVVAEVSASFGTQFWTEAWQTRVSSYGFVPRVVVVNVDMSNVDALSAAPQTELEQFEAFVKAGKAAGGVEILAPVSSPNGSGGSGPEGDARTLAIRHPWSDSWWDRFRSMAQAGGGIAFDAPPAFFLHGLANQTQVSAYQAFTIAGLKWATDHHLWSAFIVSPFLDAPTFQIDAETVYKALKKADALPQTWIIENYNECGPPYPKACTSADAAFMAPVGKENEPNTEASIALWFSKNAAVQQP